MKLWLLNARSKGQPWLLPPEQKMGRNIQVTDSWIDYGFAAWSSGWEGVHLFANRITPALSATS